MKFLNKIIFYALIFIAFSGFCPVAKSAQLMHIRFGKQDEKTVRFVAHLDKEVKTNVFSLQNPSRVVIDFSETSFSKDVSKRIDLPNILVKKVRFGQANNKEARVVLELDTDMSFNKGFFLKPSEKNSEYRFVLDIKATGKKSSSEPLKKQVVIDSSRTQKVKENIERYKSGHKPIIVLDPGHGGADPGAISARGNYEKHLTLKMAKEVKTALERTGRYKVYMTRETDKALTLRGRMQFAHKQNADLFISIHADSAKNKKAKGLSVYTISEKASDKEAMMLAERENKADIILGMDLSNETKEVSNILIDLAKRDTMEKSSQYANMLVGEMASQVELVKNAHRFAGFVVLKSTNVPSVLLEIGYLSNKEEERLLHQTSYRARLTKAMVTAINRYFDNIYE